MFSLNPGLGPLRHPHEGTVRLQEGAAGGICGPQGASGRVPGRQRFGGQKLPGLVEHQLDRLKRKRNRDRAFEGDAAGDRAVAGHLEAAADRLLNHRHVERDAVARVALRGGDDYVMFRDIEPVLPVADSPTLAYEVIDYIVSVGTVRTVVEGRVVVR